MLILENHREVHEPIKIFIMPVSSFSMLCTYQEMEKQSTLQRLPLPSFDSPDWPLLDMATSEEYRFRKELIC